MAKFTFYNSAEHIQSAMLQAINAAEKEVLCQFMTLESDSVGDVWFEALYNAHKRGISVTLIVDYYVNMNINDGFTFLPHLPWTWLKIIKDRNKTLQKLGELQKAGITIKRTEPYSYFKPKSLFDRDHRKNLIVDRKTAFLTGYNPSEHNFSWHDTGVQIQDPILVNELYAACTETLYGTPIRSRITAGRHTLLQQDGLILKNMSKLISQAKSRIYIESPYFSNNQLLNQLKNKSNEKTDVMLVIPSKNNKRLYKLLYKYYLVKGHSYIRRRIHPKQMTHAKLALIDDTAIIGSSNFNGINKSEICLFTSERELVQQISNYFEKTKGEVK